MIANNCQQCGKPARVEMDDITGREIFRVGCSEKCGSDAFYGLSEETATERWNERNTKRLLNARTVMVFKK